MKILDNGAWDNPTDVGHGEDLGFAEGLYQFLKKENAFMVLDVGCGRGVYTKYLVDRNIRCWGYDGNKYTPQLTAGLCQVADFSQYVDLGIYDWVFSIEVGEHIPKQFEDNFIFNLCNHAISGIILSWALPFQNGDGHVNCQTNEYVINKMKKYSFEIDWNSTDLLKRFCAEYPYPCYWLKSTLMVFRKVKNAI